MNILTDRQEKILEWLRTRPAATIEELEAQFGVSIATVYRDAQALVSAGLAQKTTGGIKLAPPPQTASGVGQKCCNCSAPVNERTSVVIQLEDGQRQTACCPHCGLMVLGRSTGVQFALVTDFLYGRMVNARQAAFLINSTVNLCCEPSVLCFASAEDARHFQSGFGGELYTLEQSVARIDGLMNLGARADQS